MNEGTILQMKGITKRFPGIVALDNVNFELKQGEVHALVGENGAGKSTLIRVLAGIYRMDEGSITFDGKTVNAPNSSKQQELPIAFIHQELNLVPYFDSYENIFLGLTYPQNSLGLINWREFHKCVDRVAKDLDLDFNLKSPVAQLDPSQRRMVMVAHSLIHNAKVIVMDESTAALGEKNIELLLKLVKNLKKQGVSVIYISHRLDEIFEVADRVTVLRDGKNVLTCPIKDIDIHRLIALMLNKTLREEYPKEAIPIGPELFSISNLSRHPAINDISFSLHQGEILGITGLMGSGKTELARALFGIDYKDQGQLLLEGQRVEIRSVQDAIRLGIVLIPEERREQGLILNMSLKENITLPNLNKYLLFGHLGILSSKKELTCVHKFIEEFSISSNGPNQLVELLSGGNQQKVVISKWLAGTAKVIIFDEPTKGIDVGSKTEIYRLIGKAAQRGAGIILISSEIQEIMGICDRVLVLSKGQIIKEMNVKETTSHELLESCYGRMAK